MTEIDAIGLSCPMPVLRLQKVLRETPSQARVTLLATDPMAKVDVPHFVSKNGHTLIDHLTQAKAAPGGLDLLIFEVEKA
tara:strand:+ start:3459 stop:3698 length:240 start_codon:yes stop_codon:yes gene_type:complete